MKRSVIWILTITLVIGLCACGQNAVGAWQEQYDLGIRYISEGNYEEAIIAFTAAIEIDPKRSESFIGRGNAYTLSGDTEDNLSAAQADYEAAIALDETMPGGWLGLADVYIRRGDYDKAIEILRKALKKTENDQSIADKLAEMEGGRFSDSAGHVRRMNTYDGDRNLVWYHTYTYDDQGREASVTSFDGAGKQTGYVDEVYTEDGDILVSYHYASETGEVGKLVYEYDDAGNEVKDIFYSVNGEIQTIFQSEFDGNGNRIREEERSPEGDLKGYNTYIYDGMGREIRRDSFNAESVLYAYQTKEYTEDGYLDQYCDYSSDGTMNWCEVYHYDEMGNCLGFDEYDGAGKLIRSTVNES